MDKRRFFTKAEKAALYSFAKGLCQECSEPLGSGWHADHDDPHVRGGRTLISNGQALCSACNLKKGARMIFRDTFRPRPFQEQVIQAVLDNHAAGERVTVALGAPGSGKELTGQAVASHLYREGIIDYVLTLVPRITLARQCELNWRKAVVEEPRRNNEADWAGNFMLFDRRGRIEFIEHVPNRNPLFEPGTTGRGIVTTYSSLVSAIGQTTFADFAERHKGRFLVVADEAQFCGAANDTSAGTRAGAMVEMLSHHAAHTLLMTGTPYRSDDTKLILCEYDEPNADGLRKLLCHAEATYQDGVREGYLRKFEFHLTDARMRRRDRKTAVVTEYDLSMDGSDLRQGLRRPDMWRPLVEQVVSAVRRKQKQHQDYRAIISCMEQKEARAVWEHLRTNYPSLRLRLALSDDGDEARTQLQSFKDEPADILITVRMAFIGYDCKEITVVGVLTNYRDSGHLLQLVGRGMRVWDKTPFKTQSCLVIAPDDPEMQKFVQELQQQSDAGWREREKGSGGGEGPDEEGPTTVLDDAQPSGTRAVGNQLEIDQDRYVMLGAMADDLGLVDDLTKLADLLDRINGTGSPAPEPRVEQPAPVTVPPPTLTAAQRIDVLKSEVRDDVIGALSDQEIYPGSYGYDDACKVQWKRVSRRCGITAARAKTEEDHLRRRNAARWLRQQASQDA